MAILHCCKPFHTESNITHDVQNLFSATKGAVDSSKAPSLANLLTPTSATPTHSDASHTHTLILVHTSTELTMQIILKQCIKCAVFNLTKHVLSVCVVY